MISFEVCEFKETLEGTVEQKRALLVSEVADAQSLDGEVELTLKNGEVLKVKSTEFVAEALSELGLQLSFTPGEIIPE